MDEHAMALIESVLGRLRTAAGRSWVEPERIRLTLTAKARPMRSKDEPPVVSMVVEIQSHGAEITVTRTASGERIVSRAR